MAPMFKSRVVVLGIVILSALALGAIAGAGLVHGATVAEKKVTSIGLPRITVSLNNNSGRTRMSCTRKSTDLEIGGIRIGEAAITTCRNRVGAPAVRNRVHTQADSLRRETVGRSPDG